MEVKISISDGGSTPATVEMSGQATGSAASGTYAAAAASGDVTDAGQAGMGGGSGMSMGGDLAGSVPPDLLMRAAAMGAMNAGPAPDLSMFQQGAPPPFITGQMGQMASFLGRLAQPRRSRRVPRPVP